MKKKSNYIFIIITMTIFIIFNFAFNILNDALNQHTENLNLSKKVNVLELSFNNSKTLKDITSIMNYFKDENINSSFSNNIELFDSSSTNELNKPILSTVYALTDSNLFNYKISKGRNFNELDFINKNKVVIISYLFENLTYEKNNLTYINIDGEPYEVIGFIKNLAGKSFYHYNIFMPYTSIPTSWYSFKIEDLIINSLIVDKNLSITLEDQKLKTFDLNFLNLRDLKISSISENLAYMKEDLFNFFILGISSLLNIFLFSFYWIKCRKKDFFIYKALGYNNNSLYKKIISELSILLIFSTISSNVIYYFIEIIFSKKVFSMTIAWSYYMIFADLILSIFILLLVCFIFSFMIISKNINKNINKNSKLSKNYLVKFLIILQIFIMNVNFITSFELLSHYNERINKLSKLQKDSSVFFTNSFSVSLDDNKLKNINVESLFNDLELNNIDTLNYFYDFITLIDKSKINFNSSEQLFFKFASTLDDESKVDNIALTLFINEKLLKEKFFLGNYNLSETNSNDYIEIILGNSYKDKFKINEFIKTIDGQTYKIIGFLNKESFYNNNQSSLVLDNLIPIDDLILIPFKSINDIKKLSSNINSENESSFYYKLLTNGIYSVETESEKNHLVNQLKKYDIDLINSNYAIEDFNYGYIPIIFFKFIFSILTFFISLIGILSFVLIMILDNKYSINIKYILGYRKKFILIEYLKKIFFLFLIANTLTLFAFLLDPFKSLNSILFKCLIFNFILISIPIIFIILNILKKLKPSDLLKGD